ncbi:MAG: glutamate synthase subunit beta [Eubacteriales bacterium]|nr:glutamate synthase subunit beta [Eubacteriales bacterium]
MGKPTGFMDFKRELPPDRQPLDRINDWNEFHEHFSDDKQQTQGARCMDCGIPFCHTGLLIKGAASGCPINNLIPEWNDLIYRGRWKEAWERLKKTNNFPEFTGRVCPAPCEGACTVGINEPQVTIKNNEVYIIDKAWEEGWVNPQPPKVRSGKKVAVIGSGPSGLACADQLNKAGHTVTVYERADRTGGLLMYGIPNMKLDKNVVQRRVDLMAAEGVTFVTSCEVGKDLPAAKVKAENDAIVLCGGATKPRDLPIEGRALPGVYFAMEFLKANTKSLLDSQLADGNAISAKGKDVLVIGGGDTGTDCVGTSIRHGCKSVNQIEIMPRPVEQRAATNPWPEWPFVLKTDYGQEESIALYGKDPRTYLTTAKKFVSDEQGNLKEVHTIEVKWEKNDKGAMIPVEQPGTEKVWPAQLVLLAMGFLGPEDTVLADLGVARDPRSNAQAEHDKHTTNLSGIFAAGDMRRGQSLVVWAINEGRAAARECDRFLMGETQLP